MGQPSYSSAAAGPMRTTERESARPNEQFTVANNGVTQ
jgi:hypothetical protein